MFCSDCLCNGDKQANYDSKQSYTFDKGGGQNHVGSDVTTSFGLACDGFNGTLTDVTDTKACCDGCNTCTKAGTHFTDSA